MPVICSILLTIPSLFVSYSRRFGTPENPTIYLSVPTFIVDECNFYEH
jgi:hypothetical protein